MNDTTIPKGKLTRTLSSGRIAARMGKNQMKYWLRKPFLAKEKKGEAKKALTADNARTLFDGLALLRGTALKAAQMLSMETDFFPDEFRRELEKSYHQVPPINRALVRKIIQTNFHRAPEALFDRFETAAFAAASLGQVHEAQTSDGEDLAVKIQYPGIRDTISNDIRMLKTLAYPKAEYEILKTALEEIETVLVRETDYQKEAEHLDFFRQNLDLPGVRIPKVYPHLSTGQVLTMSRLRGRVLSDWLKTGPDEAARTRVAQTLNDIFIKGFYELNLIHADPNPGNFLIMDDLKIGLLDFGCVRRFEPRFIRLYKKLLRTAGNRDPEAFRSLFMELGFISPDLDRDIQDAMASLFRDMGGWYGRLFRDETFDFKANPDFMEQGKKLGMRMHQFSKHIHRINPEFIFLDRTRYGLIRLFEKMGVCLKMRNAYEFCG